MNNNNESVQIGDNSVASPNRNMEAEISRAIRKNNFFMLGVAAAVLVGYGIFSAFILNSNNESNNTASVAETTTTEQVESNVQNPALTDDPLAVQEGEVGGADAIVPPENLSSSIDLATVKLPKGVEKVDGGYVLGDPNAEVAVEVWADFQCPYCASFDADASEPLIFAEDNGAIKNEYYYAAFLSPGSLKAANALGCAADQDKFREFKKFAYELQTQQPGEFTDEILLDAGEEIGVADQDAYKTCVEEGTYNDYALVTTDLMPQRGVSGTPTVFVDGENVFQSGISFEEFLSRIGLNVVDEEQPAG